MNFLNFGYVLKKVRTQLNISRKEMISILDYTSANGSRIDNVAVSRWENNVITPCHRRQVDIVKQLNLELINLVDSRSFTVDAPYVKEYLIDKLLSSVFWDFDSERVLDEFRRTKINKQSKGLESYFYFSDDGLPVGQITFSVQSNIRNRGKMSIVIKSIFASSKSVLLDIFNVIFSRMVLGEVSSILYYSATQSSPIYKMLKELGFKCLPKEDERYIMSSSYDDAVYNPLLFLLSTSFVKWMK